MSMIFPFFFVVFNFLHPCLIVYPVQVFTSLVRFILRYFILLDAIVNEIILISISDSLLLVYRLCILILYLASLFISSNFFWHCLQDFLYTVSCHLQTDTFTSFFPIWIPFIYLFSCLIAVARTSKTVLQKVVRVGILSCSLCQRKCFHLFTIEYNVGCRFVIFSFYCIMFPLYPLC